MTHEYSNMLFTTANHGRYAEPEECSLQNEYKKRVGERHMFIWETRNKREFLYSLSAHKARTLVRLINIKVC
jgi:hypothetical protein